jgi:hypothetical protein
VSHRTWLPAGWAIRCTSDSRPDGESPLSSHCVEICSRFCCRTSGSPSSLPAESTFRRAVSMTVLDSALHGACLAAGCSLFRPWTLHDMMAGRWSSAPSRDCTKDQDVTLSVGTGTGSGISQIPIDRAQRRTSSVVRLDLVSVSLSDQRAFTVARIRWRFFVLFCSHPTPTPTLCHAVAVGGTAVLAQDQVPC